jgi:hypothetical protein
MPFAALQKGDSGPNVRELQRLLVDSGYVVDIDGDFGAETARGVKAFQTQHLDQHGQPLVVDGNVGPLTWWALTHARPDLPPANLPVDFRVMPSRTAGGSSRGRAALAAAIAELGANACEIGGNNRGPWVRKYLNGEAAEGSSWCAGFVSWCYANSQPPLPAPFVYSVGARDLLAQGKAKGWAKEPGSEYEPLPGDLVIWWRVTLSGWRGHAGMAYETRDGMLYTIEGNKSPRVQGFSYVLSRMEKLLGYIHVPDA